MTGSDLGPRLGERSLDRRELDLMSLGRHIDKLRCRIAALVEVRRTVDPAPDDPFRGLHISDDLVDVMVRSLGGRGLPPGFDGGLSESPRGESPDGEPPGGESSGELRPRLAELQRSFGLDDADVDLLICAALPEIDSDVERLYGYLNDDVSRRRASVELAMHLALLAPASTCARQRLIPSGTLVRRRLVTVSDDRPFLSCEVTVPARVVEHLLGSDEPDPSLAGALVLGAAGAPFEPLRQMLQRSPGAVYVRAKDWTVARAAAVDAVSANAALHPPVVVDAEELRSRLVAGSGAGGGIGRAEGHTVAITASREAHLRSTRLVIGPAEALADIPGALAALVDDASTVIVGSDRWNPAWSRRSPVDVEVPPQSATQRKATWSSLLCADVGIDTAELAMLDTFVLGPDATAASVARARADADARGEVLAIEHLLRGARAQNAGGLERLARRIEPAVTLRDMVLRPLERSLLADLATRVRTRTVVLEDWGMRPGGGRGRGVTALFAGEPGTGKTMAVEALAGELGLDVYAVDLAAVVDKYIGETEKNLDRIFVEAEHVNAVLFFDEADALFGKRSDISDAHDRNANLEVAYLLQRMESFDGLAVLATNLRGNLDAAFSRRLDLIIDFELPDETHRRALWDRCLGDVIRRADDVDLDVCARLELSGGDIRSVVVTAAYRVAAEGGLLTMNHLMAAAIAEYRKLGRLIGVREFGRWASEAADTRAGG